MSISSAMPLGETKEMAALEGKDRVQIGQWITTEKDATLDFYRDRGVLKTLLESVASSQENGVAEAHQALIKRVIKTGVSRKKIAANSAAKAILTFFATQVQSSPHAEEVLSAMMSQLKTPLSDKKFLVMIGPCTGSPTELFFLKKMKDPSSIAQHAMANQPVSAETEGSKGSKTTQAGSISMLWDRSAKELETVFSSKPPKTIRGRKNVVNCIAFLVKHAELAKENGEEVDLETYRKLVYMVLAQYKPALLTTRAFALAFIYKVITRALQNTPANSVSHHIMGFARTRILEMKKSSLTAEAKAEYSKDIEPGVGLKQRIIAGALSEHFNVGDNTVRNHTFRPKPPIS